MKNNSKFIDYLLIIAGLIFVVFYISKDKVNSLTDLIDVQGVVNNYSFEEYHGSRSHTYSYYIYLNEYQNNFQICAEFVDRFSRSSFEGNVKIGDTLKIKIAKTDSKELGHQSKIIIFGIENANGVYMNADQTIKDYNSITLLIFGLGFMITGLALLRFDKRKN